MTAETLAAALIADVPRYDASAVMWTLEDVEPKSTADGGWVRYSDVLAALSTALDPALTERAGEVLEALLHEERIATSAEAVDFRNTADLITALLTANAALRANTVQALDEADREYSRKTNDLIERHAEQLAALRAERDLALAGNRGLVRLNEATEARAERFRSALEEIAEYDTGATAGLAYTARAALTTEARHDG